MPPVVNIGSEFWLFATCVVLLFGAAAWMIITELIDWWQHRPSAQHDELARRRLGRIVAGTPGSTAIRAKGRDDRSGVEPRQGDHR